MHGLVLTDAAGEAVGPALLWPDARAEDELARWRALPPEQRARLGNPLAPGMTGPLLSWVRAHHPVRYQQTRWALLPKDWLRGQLTGIDMGVTDPSDASATLLWDVQTDAWAYPVATAIGVDTELLPAVEPADAVAGTLTQRAADELGLPAGAPVAVGAADTAAGLLATGVADPAQVQITVGSGAQVVRPIHSPTPTATPRYHRYRTATGSGWYAMAAVQNAGVALDQACRMLGASWAELYASLEHVPPEASEVTFLPYLSGERRPNQVPAGSGGWVGLGLTSERDDLLRAALEGVACLIHHAFHILPGKIPEQALLVGGGGRDPRFRQLLADILQVPIRPLEVADASAVGAALLAASATRTPVLHELERHRDILPQHHDYTPVLERFRIQTTAHTAADRLA